MIINLDVDVWSSIWEWCSHLNSTFSFPISCSSNHNVSTHSPTSSPWIFHLEVVLSIVATITHCEHSVIQICSTVSIVNSWLVQLEGKVICLNGNWCGLLVDASHQINFLVNSNFCAITNGPNFISFLLVVAWTSNSSVRIFFFFGNSIILHVEEGEVH